MRGRCKSSPENMLPQRRMHSTSPGAMFPTSVLAIGSALCVVVLFAAFRAILGGGDGSSAIFASATRLDLSNQGLVQLPPDIFEKTELSHLDISHNKLTSLPSEIGHLATLTNLNCAGNQLASLPSQIGTLTALQLFGLKDNLLKELPSEIGQLTSLQGLFLTGNQLTTLPSEVGNLSTLRKLQAGANHFTSLPSQLGQLKNLELFRVPMNSLSALPPSLKKCPSLAWLALGANPLTESAKDLRSAPLSPAVLNPAAVSISLGSNLADVEYGGAANDGVHPGTYTDPTTGGTVKVAVKFFKPGLGPDGDPKDEMLVGAAVRELLVRKRSSATTTSDSSTLYSRSGPLSNQLGVLTSPRAAAVFQLVENATPLARKPLDSVRMLRGRWEHIAVPSSFMLGVVADVVEAMAMLHEAGIAHGDLYAHNIMVHRDRAGPLVGSNGVRFAEVFDFGAAFFYAPTQRDTVEPVEVRAFGLLLRDMVDFMTSSSSTNDPSWPYLSALADACSLRQPSARPRFSTIHRAAAKLRDEGVSSASQEYEL